MEAQNCWEHMRCGRELGGAKADELGICPAALDTSADGLNQGDNGGRICWAITGTFCGSSVQGTFAEKRLSCMSCEFYKLVREEEGTARFRIMKPGQTYTPSERRNHRG